MKQYELPGQSDKEVPCSNHPMAPHGFNRNASHNNDRYTCECEGWFEDMIESIICNLDYITKQLDAEDNAITIESINKEIEFLKGVKDG